MIPKVAIEIVVNLWPMLILSVASFLCLRVSYTLAHKKRFEVYKEVINLVFIVYILLLFSLVTTTDFSSYGNNFIPFKEMFRYSFTSKLFYRNVIGNIILFIPFGFFINYHIHSKKIWYSLISTSFISLLIELVQLLLGRSFDIDDIILNIIGGIIGYLMYLLVELIFKKTSEKIKNGFLLNLICMIIIIVLYVIILSLYGVIV